MPSKNVIKTFVENSYYHTYNRGVEKRNIFIDDTDYRVFLNLLKYSLLPPEQTTSFVSHPIATVTGCNPVRIRTLKNFHGEIKLLSYCLMPNHFHLLVWQSKKDSMSKLMQSVCTSYSMYFNKKYQRVGRLFQGTYKATRVDVDGYLLHLSRYIHLNPKSLTGCNPVTYPYSSYQHYLGNKHSAWVIPDVILAYFKRVRKTNFNDLFSYESFVEDFDEDASALIGMLTIDAKED